jgi:Cu(I)/Ag(I) efflux system membrane protein CusA/SilA
MCFIAMKYFGVDANIVALSGIAIAIGTMVDMGIVICENILRHLERASPDAPRLEVVHRAASEVGSAVLTAVSTTIVGFLPVFTMTGAEGKLFKPLAFTKTFALLASIIIALTVIPVGALILFTGKISAKKMRWIFYGIIAAAGIAIAVHGIQIGSFIVGLGGVIILLFALYGIAQVRIPERIKAKIPLVANFLIVIFVAVLLSIFWEPLGPQKGFIRNFIFVAALVGILLGFFRLFIVFYPAMLRWTLAHKVVLISGVVLVIGFGLTVWLGFDKTFGWVPNAAEKVGIDPNTTRSMTFWVKGGEEFPGFGKEFMPPLDEGSYLYMPTTMVHASIGEAGDILAKQDMAFRNIPEIDSVVGKIGRVESPLDPAPISMVETIINYKPEYKTDKNGRRINFRYDKKRSQFVRDADGELIPDPHGRPFRQWRDQIKTPDDIWEEIVKAGKIPGTTSAPKLQPIAARIVMLQSGMRAPMGIKIKGPSLETIEGVGLQIEGFLKEVPSVEPSAVIADRIVGKPYLEIIPDRKALDRYGVKIRDFQEVVEVAIGGKKITTTVMGRERFPVRVRYQRELRDSIETIGKILVPAKGGKQQIPITELAEIRYVRGPQVIKSEDTFLTGYVLFDKKPGHAEVNVVEDCQRYLQSKIDNGELVLPRGVSYTFAGSYENQIRAQKKLAVVLPLALFIIFLILYFQFKSIPTTLLVFSGIFVAWAGGFILIWMYGQPWFLDFSVFGVSMRQLFQVHTINLSVAVWVGFLALFGIASDNGVIQSTYLDQVFRERKPASTKEIREATIVAAQRRIRPCLMTSATTILALIPVLTSVGRGSDVMVPMAIPSFGGMLVVLISIFVVPVLYCWIKERSINRQVSSS